MILDSDRLKKGTFRNLVIALFVSFAYDLFWLYVSTTGYRSGELDDGGLVKTIKQFSLIMAFLSFIFRVRLILVMIILSIVCGYFSILEGFNRLLENNQEERLVQGDSLIDEL